ncbi:HalOD1 output domain-containing protein [Natrialbaceae archaeon A-CW2]|uniref:HalOD1 output domain-containing protein n=1 Tax=Natronosalvus amylolyticus TaxID=2961994 RepID=UPI0020C9EFD4|nr:HalOD1 output domain-containing protein [Natronosalvus amylolyticus]
MTERDVPAQPTTEYYYDGQVTPSVAVVMAIADHEGCDPEAFDFTLYEYVDPDALDALVGEHRQLGCEATEVDIIVDEYHVSVQTESVIVTDRV